MACSNSNRVIAFTFGLILLRKVRTLLIPQTMGLIVPVLFYKYGFGL